MTSSLAVNHIFCLQHMSYCIWRGRSKRLRIEWRVDRMLRSNGNREHFSLSLLQERNRFLSFALGWRRYWQRLCARKSSKASVCVIRQDDLRSQGIIVTRRANESFKRNIKDTAWSVHPLKSKDSFSRLPRSRRPLKQKKTLVHTGKSPWLETLDESLTRT